MSGIQHQEQQDHQQRSTQHLRPNVLGAGGLVFTVIAMVGPMAAFMSAGPLIMSIIGPGVSGVFLIATALFLLYAVGYLALSRRIGSASGFISFISRGLGQRYGVAAAYVTLCTYTTLIAGLYGAYALFLQQMFRDLFGLDLHWGAWAVLGILVNAVLSYNRVEFSMRLMGVLLILAVVAVLVLDVAVIAAGGAGGGFTFAGFTPDAVFGAGFGFAALFALGSFAGVESTAVFSEEVRNARRTVPRALYIAIAVLGTFYVFSTWVIVNAVGAAEVQQAALADPTGFIFGIAADYVGEPLAVVLSVLVVTSFFAVLLGFTNVFSRYIFSLGRAGILPSAVGRSHPRHQSPHVASVVGATLMILLVGGFIVTGADPFAHLYSWMLAIGTVGVLFLLCASSVAVVGYFRRDRHDPVSAWVGVVAPSLSAVAFAAAIVVAVLQFDVLAASEGLASWLWLLIPVAALVGYVVAARPRYRGVSFDVEP